MLIQFERDLFVVALWYLSDANENMKDWLIDWLTDWLIDWSNSTALLNTQRSSKQVLA